MNVVPGGSHATSIKLPAYERCLRFLDGIKKTPVLKRGELYRGLIEPGWGAGLLNPAQGGERNILYKTPLTLKSFLLQALGITRSN
jgi:hypothetical protein